jgi:hypothetical protein
MLLYSYVFLQEITRAIRACLTAEQVVQVIEQRLDSMNAINLSAALDKLSKLQCEQQQPYAACVQRYAEFAADYSTRNLSTVVHALWCAPAGISQQHQQAVHALLLPALVAKQAEAAPQDISTLLSAAAKSSQQLDKHVLLQLLDSYISKLQQASAQSLSNMLWAVATMRQQVPAGQLQQILSALLGILQQDRTPRMWAVASMGQFVLVRQLQQGAGGVCDARRVYMLPVLIAARLVCRHHCCVASGCRSAAVIAVLDQPAIGLLCLYWVQRGSSKAAVCMRL